MNIFCILQNKKIFFNPLEEHRHWCGWVTERNLNQDLSDIYYEDLRGFRVLISQIKAYLKPDITKERNSALKNVSIFFTYH